MYALQISAFSAGEPGVPLMPNVLKVFLENGQTKSFKYDSTTRVGDVVASLQQKLCIRAIHHFSLVLEQVKSLRRNKLTLLNPEHTLARVRIHIQVTSFKSKVSVIIVTFQCNYSP